MTDQNKITKADEPLIAEWKNCRAVSVDADGDVWIADPCAGHWLSGEKKAEFLAWRDSRGSL